MVAYAPLHIRSHYSFHDSLLSVRTIIARATELGLPAVGLTDPNLHAAVEFFLAAREASWSFTFMITFTKARGGEVKSLRLLVGGKLIIRVSHHGLCLQM